jgi:hypothetical protein
MIGPAIASLADYAALGKAFFVGSIGRTNWNSAPFMPSDDAVS